MFNAGLETTHLWRGLEVSKGLTFNNEFSLSDNNNHFKIGLWGGMQINGDYKEFDYYVNYNNSYDFAVKAGFPLTLYWSTIVAGRDRGTANKQNIYSSWVQASYKFYEDEQFRVDGSVAGAFALNNYDENANDHFYGKSSGINDVRVGCTYKLKVGKHPMPVTAQGIWNPEANKGYFRVGITLLDL